MLIKRENIYFSVIVGINCFLLFACDALAAEYTITQLTNDNYSHYSPKIHNGQVVWDGSNGFGQEIFLYDGVKITQISNQPPSASSQIHNGQITWVGQEPGGNDGEIYFYDGAQIIRLTNNIYNDYAPQIHNGRVAWYGYDGHDYEIFLYDGGQNIQLTDNNYNDYSPQIHNGNVTWYGVGSDGYDYEIFFYKDAQVVQITDNVYTDRDPQIHNGQIVWQTFMWDIVGDRVRGDEIFFYNGANIIQLTDNLYADQYPQIHNGQIVWHGSPDWNDYEIFFSQGGAPIQITNNSSQDWFPKIHNGQVVWEGWDGNDWEIYSYGGLQVTDNNYDDRRPQIHNGQVTWHGYDGNDYEIFLAMRGETVSKLPLGGSKEVTDVSDPQLYKIYVPSRWGGMLTVTTNNGWVELYYPDADTKVVDVNSEISHAIREGNHGWYYVKHYGANSYTISNAFVEEGGALAERKPWNISTWVPFSDVLDDGSNFSEIENLYDDFGPLRKYDEAVYGGLLSPATDWEMGKSILDLGGTLGHYIYNGNARETFAEKDWKFDWNENFVVEDTGPYDFYNSVTNQLGRGAGDGDLTDGYNTTWWGHCDGWATAAIIFKDPANLMLQGDFTVDDIKALLTEVGMRQLNKADRVVKKTMGNVEEGWTKIFHDFLREWLKKEQKTVLGDLKAVSRRKEEVGEVWNHPIWYYAAEMKERAGGDEKIVDVTLTLKSADDLGHNFREDSDRSVIDKAGEGAYGAGAWRYHLAYDDNGEIVGTGSGWDTVASDDPNTKYIIPYLFHPKSEDDVFEQESGRANPEVTEENIKTHAVVGEIRRISW